MAHTTIRATMIPEIVKLICASQNISEEEALDMFYCSATAASYADDDTGLYGQSALYIHSLFEEELRERKEGKI